MRRAATPILAALLLAGCLGGDAAPAAPASPDASSILGTVTDAELVPVEGAEVQLFLAAEPGLPQSVRTTDASGHFEFESVEPGQYILYAKQVGLVGQPKKLDVGFGVALRVSVAMDQAVVIAPFHESVTFTNYFRYAVCVLGPGVTRCTTASSTANQTYALQVDEAKWGPLSTLVVEATWEPAVSTCAGGVRTDVYSPQQQYFDQPDTSGQSSTIGDDNPYHWDNLPQVDNPTLLHINRYGLDGMLSAERTALNGGNPIKTSGRWIFSIWNQPRGVFGTPVDASCLVDETIQTWVTLFYVDAAPDAAWRLLEEP